MIDKIKSLLSRINPRSPIFIAAIFSTFFIFLILVTLQLRVQQQQESNTAQNLPTLTPPLVPGKDFVQGQINVKFKDGLTDAEINNSLSKYDARIKSTISGINVKVVEVPAGQEEAVRAQLIKDGLVKYAELDVVIHVLVSPNDTNYNLQYGLKNMGQMIQSQVGTTNADVHAEAAWEVTKGTGIKVAVLDTGLDLNHPEFAGRVAAQRVFVTSSIDDAYGHGTHVAGVIAANSNNGQGIAGVCPECQLMIGKVADDRGGSSVSLVSQGINWAADNNSKVISMSLARPDFNSQVLADAVAYAWGKGVVLVAAAGNCGGSNYLDNNCSTQNPVEYPAGYPHVVSVAATDNKDQKTAFSEHGSWVTVAAPGKDIASTLPTHQNQIGVTNYGYLSGTSMAAPMVAGIVALIWSTPPYNTSNQVVVDRLYATADQITGTGTYWQKGRVNAGAAVASQSATITPTITPTTTPTITDSPTASPSPTGPAPTFVCAGSPDSICNPTLTQGASPNPTVTGQPNPSVTDIAPSASPSANPNPTNTPPCTGNTGGGLLGGFWQLIMDFIGKLFQLIGRGTPPAIPCPGSNQTGLPTGTPNQPNIQQPNVAIPSNIQNLVPSSLPGGFQNINLPGGGSGGSSGGSQAGLPVVLVEAAQAEAVEAPVVEVQVVLAVDPPVVVLVAHRVVHPEVVVEVLAVDQAGGAQEDHQEEAVVPLVNHLAIANFTQELDSSCII